MSLGKEIWKLKVPILIIVPFLSAVFVKASLPPYYSDEMAYHYISPLALKLLAPIKYVGDFYADLPRTLDIFWQLVFSLFHTYSVARLFHFTILATSMLYAYAMIRKNFGFLYAFLFVFTFFAIPQDIVFNSTLGFIDIGAMAFLSIGLISGIDFVINKSESSIIYAFLFWGMSLGTKYTGTTSFAAFLLVFSILLIKFRKEYLKFFNFTLILKLIFAFLIFGGYWYIKNLIAYGNPIYPFIFHCWGAVAKDCPNTTSFGNWTTTINLKALYPILTELLPKDVFVRILAVAVPVIALFGTNKKLKWIIVSLFATVVVEIVMLKYFSGFYLRYHQHMELYLLLGVILVLSNKYKNRLVETVVKLSLLGLITTSIFTYIYTVHYTISNSVNWNEINYSIGKSNIYDWVDYVFPRMKYITRWCENPPGGKPVQIAKFEPDIIWHEPRRLDDYHMRVFATNCSFYSPLPEIPANEALQYASDHKMKFWLASENGCVSDVEVNTQYLSGYSNEYIRILAEYLVPAMALNNKFVCNSVEIGPHLYYFDYEKLK